MTVSGIRRSAVSLIALCAAGVVVMPFMSHASAGTVFAIAVLAFPPALAAVALPRGARPMKSALTLLGLLAVSEASGLYLIGFEGSPGASLSLMVGLAGISLIGLGSLHAWVFEDGPVPAPPDSGEGDRA